MDVSQAFIAIAGRRCRRLGRQSGSEELAQLFEPDFGIFTKIQGASEYATAVHHIGGSRMLHEVVAKPAAS